MQKHEVSKEGQRQKKLQRKINKLKQNDLPEFIETEQTRTLSPSSQTSALLIMP